MTDGCAGSEHCDDHYKAPKNREFSPEQEAIIEHLSIDTSNEN